MPTVRVLFACAWGISSSLLAAKVEQAASKMGLDVKVDCLAAETALGVNLKEYDAVLIGPQVRFYQSKFEQQAKEKGLTIPVSPVDGLLYAMADGEPVLKQLLKDLKKIGKIPDESAK
jgi:PTS system cellobiose-specific IIB component